MSSITCAHCPYWQAPRNSFTGELLPLQIQQADGSTLSVSGQCRRRAPSSGFWPMTHSIDWCGEHPSLQPRAVISLPAEECK